MAFARKLGYLDKEDPQPPMTQNAPSLEKRHQRRFTAQFRSTISSGQKEGQGRTLDLSAGGCMIETDLTVAVGACFECRIYLPGLDWPLRINEAHVRWIKRNTFGIQFTKIHPEEEAKLKQVIASLDEDFKT